MDGWLRQGRALGKMIPMKASSKQSGLLDNLVTQFSSALDCFRELVQNSIDAGSQVVDIWTEYVTDQQGRAIILHVDDYGEGMGREIIDDQLTRLFASGKRRDLTKIGKFGIGFVSVFALLPRAVIVRTGRSGEYWEVFFDADRSFQISPLGTPVEGTQISIILEGDALTYRELVNDVRDTLRYWCCHAEAEVLFEDRSPFDGRTPLIETINAPFEVEGLFGAVHKHRRSHIALAYDKAPEHGFFNRGLTLARGPRGTRALKPEYAARFEHIAFKMSSPYLEHTLTRETVIRDQSFHQAMEHVEEIAAEALFPPLVDRIEALVAESQWALEHILEYLRLVEFLCREPAKLLRRASRRRVLRTLDGKPMTLHEAYVLWRRQGRLLLASGSSPLTDAIIDQGVMILFGEPRSPFNGEVGPVKLLLRRYFDARTAHSLRGTVQRWLNGKEVFSDRSRPIIEPEELYLLALQVDAPSGEAIALKQEAIELVASLGMRFRDVHLAKFPKGAEGPSRIFIVSPTPPPLTRPLDVTMASRWKLREKHGVLNMDHPHFTRLLKLFTHQPDLAARCLAGLIADCANVFRDQKAALFAQGFSDIPTGNLAPEHRQVLLEIEVDDHE